MKKTDPLSEGRMTISVRFSNFYSSILDSLGRLSGRTCLVLLTVWRRSLDTFSIKNSRQLLFDEYGGSRDHLVKCFCSLCQPCALNLRLSCSYISWWFLCVVLNWSRTMGIILYILLLWYSICLIPCHMFWDWIKTWPLYCTLSICFTVWDQHKW